MSLERRTPTTLLVPDTSPWHLHEVAFLLFVLLLPIHVPQVRMPYLVIVPGYLALALAGVASLARAVRHRVRLAHPTEVAVLALYLVAIAPSAVLSEEPRRSVAKWFIEVGYVFMAAFALQMVTSFASLRRIVLAWLAGSAVTVLVGLATIVCFYAGARPAWLGSTISNFGSLPPGNYVRVGALFHLTNPNSLCHYLSVSLLLVLLAEAAGWLGSTAACLLRVGIYIVALFTFSPQLGGLLLGAGWWLRWTLRSDGRKLGSLIAGWLGVAAAVIFLVAILISPVSSGERGGPLPFVGWRVEPSARILCWESAWKSYLDHPWFGRGIGVQTACPDYLVASGSVARLSDAHSLYLSLASTKGLAGLVGFGAVLATMLRRSIPLQAPSSVGRLALGTLTIAIVQGFLYQGLSGSFEYILHNWVLLGMLGAVAGLVEDPASAGRPQPAEASVTPAP